VFRARKRLHEGISQVLAGSAPSARAPARRRAVA